MLSLSGNGQFDWRSIAYASGSSVSGLTKTAGGSPSTNWAVDTGAIYTTDANKAMAVFTTVDVPTGTPILMQIMEAEVRFPTGTSGSGVRFAGVGIGDEPYAGANVLPTYLQPRGVAAGIQYDYAAEEFQPDLIGTPLALNEWIHVRLFVGNDRVITWINGVMCQSVTLMLDVSGTSYPVRIATGVMGVLNDNKGGFGAQPVFRNLRAYAVLAEMPT